MCVTALVDKTEVDGAIIGMRRADKRNGAFAPSPLDVLS